MPPPFLLDSDAMKRLAGLVLLTLLVSGIASAQFGFFRQRDPNPLPPFPKAEFHFARMHYASRGSWWSIDYPDAEIHFLPALRRFTRIDAVDDSAHVNLNDEELFDYPFLFLQQPGQDPWTPTDEEARRLRDYLFRGGFLLVDDFHSQWEWQAVQQAMNRVLPELPVVPLKEEDAVLNIVFDLQLDANSQIPGERHLGGRMEGPPGWYGVYDADGRLLVALHHNVDMGDAWEHADDAHYPLEMTALAYRFGVNYVVYAMTH
jgi:hypothetical protein